MLGSEDLTISLAVIIQHYQTNCVYAEKLLQQYCC